jgi:hypothetical protein
MKRDELTQGRKVWCIVEAGRFSDERLTEPHEVSVVAVDGDFGPITVQNEYGGNFVTHTEDYLFPTKEAAVIGHIQARLDRLESRFKGLSDD